MAIFESILSDEMGQYAVIDLLTECRKVTTMNNLNILERVMDSVNICISAPAFAFLYRGKPNVSAFIRKSFYYVALGFFK